MFLVILWLDFCNFEGRFYEDGVGREYCNVNFDWLYCYRTSTLCM